MPNIHTPLEMELLDSVTQVFKIKEPIRLPDITLSQVVLAQTFKTLLLNNQHQFALMPQHGKIIKVVSSPTAVPKSIIAFSLSDTLKVPTGTSKINGPPHGVNKDLFNSLGETPALFVNKPKFPPSQPID